MPGTEADLGAKAGRCSRSAAYDYAIDDYAAALKSPQLPSGHKSRHDAAKLAIDDLPRHV
jgi:hypothetical protein